MKQNPYCFRRKASRVGAQNALVADCADNAERATGGREEARFRCWPCGARSVAAEPNGAAPEGTSASSPKGLAFGPSAPGSVYRP